MHWYVGFIDCCTCAEYHILQNPLAFVLRAAQIYPNKLAIIHPDVEHPVAYSYAVWYVVPLELNSSDLHTNGDPSSGRNVSRTLPMA